MANKYETECKECGKKEIFTEWRDLKYAKWKIIAWSVNKNEPICICPNCEYSGCVKIIKKK